MMHNFIENVCCAGIATIQGAPRLDARHADSSMLPERVHHFLVHVAEFQRRELPDCKVKDKIVQLRFVDRAEHQTPVDKYTEPLSQVQNRDLAAGDAWEKRVKHQSQRIQR